jgi:hypothetical protein
MPMRLTHRPTRGLYAHVASSARTDAVELDRYNGQPSLLVLEIDDIPVLAWMALGAGEDHQLWLYVPLTAAEVHDFYASKPDLIADWLRPMAGREAYVGIAGHGILVLTTVWALPDVPADQFSRRVAQSVLEEVQRVLGLPEVPEGLNRELRGIKSDARVLAEAC